MVAGTRQIPGVTHVEADGLAHRLRVRYDPHLVTESAIVLAVNKVVDALAQ